MYADNCVQRTNIQNLKAIHNVCSTEVGKTLLCSKNEYTKSESNSQPAKESNIFDIIVFKERIYKIWKQFTTNIKRQLSRVALCSKNEYTKSESNSQRASLLYRYDPDCVQRTNIQNLKAIHNILLANSPGELIVFKERIYKIWKQFTTSCYVR